MSWLFGRRREKIKASAMRQVAYCASDLALDLTREGVALAQLAIADGNKPADIIADFAVVTFARDARDASTNVAAMMQLATRGLATVQTLKKWEERGLITRRGNRNSARAIINMSQPSPERAQWIEMVLERSPVSNNKVANSKM